MIRQSVNVQVRGLLWAQTGSNRRPPVCKEWRCERHATTLVTPRLGERNRASYALSSCRRFPDRPPRPYTTGVDKTQLVNDALSAQKEMDDAWVQYQEKCRARVKAFAALRDGKAGVTAFCRTVGLSTSAFYALFEEPKTGT